LALTWKRPDVVRGGAARATTSSALLLPLLVCRALVEGRPWRRRELWLGGEEPRSSACDLLLCCSWLLLAAPP
jgi:hypothetical protein